MRTIEELKAARDEAIDAGTRWTLSAEECLLLYSATLTRADLFRADLFRADLYRANLTGANLCGANLCGANLYGATLTDATLTRADLTDATLTRANLTRANLTRADLCGAKGIVRFGPLGSRSDEIYIIKHEASLMVKAGCFWGTEAAFLAAVAKTHGNNHHAKAYRAALALAHIVLDAETAEGDE